MLYTNTGHMCAHWHILLHVTWVQRRKPMRWSFVCLPKFGSVFSGAYAPFTCPSFTTHGHEHTHTPFTLKPVAVLTHTFPGVVLARGESSNGLEQACFLVRVKFWPGLKAAAIRSLPRCLWSGTRLNLHLLGELHFRYIVQASLNIAEGRRDIMLKSTPQDQAALCTGLWGWPPFLDHVEWRWSAVTHVVSHMDQEVWGTLSFHLSGHIWALLL